MFARRSGKTQDLNCTLPFHRANPEFAFSFALHLCQLRALHDHCAATPPYQNTRLAQTLCQFAKWQRTKEAFQSAWPVKGSDQWIDSRDKRDLKCLFWLYKFYEAAVSLFACVSVWTLLCAHSCASSHQTRAAPACLHCGDSWEGFYSHSQQSVGQDCKLMLKDDILS